MKAQLIDGKKIAANLRREIADKVNQRKQQGLRIPGLVEVEQVATHEGEGDLFEEVLLV